MPNPTTSDLIVCATDFSSAASSALEWALAFARREGGHVDLVHVLPEPTDKRESLAADAATFEAARLQDAREKLSQVAVEAARATNVAVRPQILTGDPDVGVVDHARRNGARMIVMGASGRPAIDRWVLGSAAERTVRSASVPVVVVPRHERGQAWLAAEPSETGGRPKALVGLEGDDSAALVTFAAGLRRREAFDVTFLHLYWPIEEF